MLFLKTLKGSELVKVDSAEVIHGLFKMQGKLDSTEMVMLFMDDNIIMPLVLERGQINVKIDNTELRVDGTPLNEALYGFFDKKNELDRRAGELERKEAKMILNGEDPLLIEHEMERESKQISVEMSSLIENFITANYNNVLGPGVFLLLCQSYPVMTPQSEDILSKVPADFRNNPYVRDYIFTARKNLHMMKEHGTTTAVNN